MAPVQDQPTTAPLSEKFALSGEGTVVGWSCTGAITCPAYPFLGCGLVPQQASPQGWRGLDQGVRAPQCAVDRRPLGVNFEALQDFRQLVGDGGREGKRQFAVL